MGMSGGIMRARWVWSPFSDLPMVHDDIPHKVVLGGGAGERMIIEPGRRPRMEFDSDSIEPVRGSS